MGSIIRPSASATIIASLLLVRETGCRKTTPTAKKCTKDTDCGQGSICVAGVCRPRKLHLEGHCDPRGTDEAGWARDRRVELIRY